MNMHGIPFACKLSIVRRLQSSANASPFRLRSGVVWPVDASWLVGMLGIAPAFAVQLISPSSGYHVESDALPLFRLSGDHSKFPMPLPLPVFVCRSGPVLPFGNQLNPVLFSRRVNVFGSITSAAVLLSLELLNFFRLMSD